MILSNIQRQDFRWLWGYDFASWLVLLSLVGGKLVSTGEGGEDVARLVVIGKSTCVERCKHYDPRYSDNPDWGKLPYCDPKGYLSLSWGGDCQFFESKQVKRGIKELLKRLLKKGGS